MSTNLNRTIFFVLVIGLAIYAAMSTLGPTVNMVPPQVSAPQGNPSEAAVTPVDSAATSLLETATAVPGEMPDAAAQEAARNRSREFRDKLASGDLPGMPDDLAEKFASAQKERQEALSTESGAKKQLLKLKECISKAGSAVPKEMLDMLPKDKPEARQNFELQIQMACLDSVQEIVEKYPSLQKEMEKVAAEISNKEAVRQYFESRRARH